MTSVEIAGDVGQITLAGERQTSLEEVGADEDEDTCPNGKTWCPGPWGEDLCCFECFLMVDDAGEIRDRASLAVRYEGGDVDE
jgi:hypothetical protein